MADTYPWANGDWGPALQGQRDIPTPPALALPPSIVMELLAGPNARAPISEYDPNDIMSSQGMRSQWQKDT